MDDITDMCSSIDAGGDTASIDLNGDTGIDLSGSEGIDLNAGGEAALAESTELNDTQETASAQEGIDLNAGSGAALAEGMELDDTQKNVSVQEDIDLNDGSEQGIEEEEYQKVLKRDPDELAALRDKIIEDNMEEVRDDLRDKNMRDGEEMEKIIEEKRRAATEEFNRDAFGEAQSDNNCGDISVQEPNEGIDYNDADTKNALTYENESTQTGYDLNGKEVEAPAADEIKELNTAEYESLSNKDMIAQEHESLSNDDITPQNDEGLSDEQSNELNDNESNEANGEKQQADSEGSDNSSPPNPPEGTDNTCPICGQSPCVCNDKSDINDNRCPKCGQAPCVCDTDEISNRKLPDFFKDSKNAENETKAINQMSENEYQGYNNAILNEPEISNDVKEIAQKNAAKLDGFDYRIKSPSKVYEKMHERGNEKDISEVNDILRYTEIHTPDTLADGANNSLRLYEDKGYTIDSVSNTWTKENPTYKGINTTLRSPTGQSFEMQYHTQESFDLKNGELHTLYEQRRVLSDSNKRAIELDDQMRDLSSRLQKPKNISEVKNR